jgi:hypothetical protein
MAVNLIVVAATFLMACFIAIWLRSPSCRPWFEAPKFPPAQWDDESVLRTKASATTSTPGKTLAAARRDTTPTISTWDNATRR